MQYCMKVGQWLLILVAVVSFGACAGDAAAVQSPAVTAEVAAAPAPTATAVPTAEPTATAEAAKEPTSPPELPTPQVVNDQALMLDVLTPDVGPLDYPTIGEISSPFEADMLYTTVEFLNASMAATEAGVALGQIPSFVALAESGRINPQLAAELRTLTSEPDTFSDASSLVSFWFEYLDDAIDLHLCSHIEVTTDGEIQRVTSDRAYRFNPTTDPLENVGLSTTPISLGEFVPCPAHPES